MCCANAAEWIFRQKYMHEGTEMKQVADKYALVCDCRPLSYSAVSEKEGKKVMKREDIWIRDPFVLKYDGKYYLYGTGIPGIEDINSSMGFCCYISEDLEEWTEPILCFEPPKDFWAEKNFWAPEVHEYQGKFYMLASFYAEGKMRATQALVSDRPEGPYKVFGEPLTPTDWMCLDGTLYIEDDRPYLVFCHEWVQVGDGEIVCVPLKKDLSKADGEPIVLFKASESGWAQPIDGGHVKGIVTDGPCLVKRDGELIMFWSSFHNGVYAVGMAISESGKLAGPWRHLDRLLFEKDGGHGMLFEGLDGKLYFSLHQPNVSPLERPYFFEIEKKEEGYRLKE